MRISRNLLVRLLAATVMADGRLASLRWWPAALMVAPLAIPLALSGLSAVGRLAVPRVTAGQALRENRCPDCACSLADVKPGNI